MSDSTNLDNLLDLWESLSAEQPKLDVEEFLTGQCAGLSPELQNLLRRKIQAIRSVDNLLFDSRSQTSSTIQLPATSSLRAQEEPVPGYILQARLGSGGFGQVWKAIGPGGFEVALKFVPRGGSAFSSESRALDLIRKIKHPHLLKVYGSWIEADWLVIASELADYSLFDRLQDAISNGEPGIPQDELLRYMRQAAEAIDFLNQVEIPELEVSGVQHRDIKPQNLLLTGDQVKLADLGISRPVSTQTVSHTGQLSIHYAAPEFFDGKTSRHSDQYGLAVTYVQLRTGHLPFRGNELEVFKGHVKGTPQLEGLSPGEKFVVQRGLAKRPADRWPSCKAFVEALASPPKMSWRQALSEQLVLSPALRWAVGAASVCVIGALVWMLLPNTWRSREASADSGGTSNPSNAVGESKVSEINRSVYGTSLPQAARWPAIEASSFSIGGEDLAQEFRVLRGLRIWQTGFGREDRLTALAGIQGIYASKSGPQLGVVQGFERTPTLEVLAEPGYIIGRIEARRAHGGRLGGMQIEFVRVEGQRLKPEDCYRVEVQVLEQVQTKTLTGSLDCPAVGYQISRTDHELGDFGLVEGYLEPLPSVENWIADNASFELLLSPEFQHRRLIGRTSTSDTAVFRTSTRDESVPLIQLGADGRLANPPASSAADQSSVEQGIENSIGMRFRLILAGAVKCNEQAAASNEADVDRENSELAKLYPPASMLDGHNSTTARLNDCWFPRGIAVKPCAYLVNRREFYCSETEVTRGQFREYIQARAAANPSKSVGFTRAERFLELGGIGYSSGTGQLSYGTGFNWSTPGFSQDDNHPVVGVSWTDAVDFCEWLSSKEGRSYRLPTAAELEFCREFEPARSGDLNSVADNRFTAAVDQEPANSLGLRSLNSNVSEWCSDLGVSVGPHDLIATNKILSGSSFLRPSNAAGNSPALHAHQNFSAPDIGFRIILEKETP
jgi:serine/threonine protein kinase